MFHFLLLVIYLSFISLGLPDALLGAAWPTIHAELQVPLSYAGVLSTIISAGTVISSLQSDRLTRRFGTGRVTCCSVGLTAIALGGFSVSHSFPLLCLWAIPYGLGAGSVDASINNYVALHYTSWHMNWLHCMWGLGAFLGPYIMGYVLTGGKSWNTGYLCICLLQSVLTVVLLFSLPQWKSHPHSRNGAAASDRPPTFRQILKLPGTKPVMLMFFCYCGLEQTAGLWASSFLALHAGLSAELAARYAGLFFLGITIGRGISSLLTLKFNDTQMVHLGQFIIFLSGIALILPAGTLIAPAALVFLGLGCAPIYPCVIHSTPAFFGSENSQAVIGMQMASAYVGTTLLPPLFGLIADSINIAWYPVFLLVIALLMAASHARLLKEVRRASTV